MKPVITTASLLLIFLFLSIPSYCDSGENKAETAVPLIMPPHDKGNEIVAKLKYRPGSMLAFDSRNRPYMFNAEHEETMGHILTLRKGSWVKLSYLNELKKTFPGFKGFTLDPEASSAKGKVGKVSHLIIRNRQSYGSLTIDDTDGLYAVVYVRDADYKPHKAYSQQRRCVLVYSPDLGRSFQFYSLPSRRAVLEKQMNHNQMSVPALALLDRIRDYPAKWTYYHRLSLLVPEKKGDRLKIPDNPAVVTEKCFGMSNHSGAYSWAVTRAGKTHLVYTECPEKPNGGNPTYAATYDRAGNKITGRKFLENAHPRNKTDVHSTPVITIDSRGYLHVLTGAHNGPFYYRRSKKPGDALGAWTKTSRAGQGQTYASLLCDRQDVLQLVYRRQRGTPGALCHRSKPAAGEKTKWSKCTDLVYPPGKRRGYVIFYHRLFSDRLGAIYISFTFLEIKRSDGGNYLRALLFSGDQGKTWKLATTNTFMKRVK